MRAGGVGSSKSIFIMRAGYEPIDGKDYIRRFSVCTRKGVETAVPRILHSSGG